MGGCLTTNSPSKRHRNPHISKSPPILEEETVKEVLSETPSGLPVKTEPLVLRDFSRKNSNAARNGAVFEKPFAAEDASEDLVSEICSTLGDSVTDDQPRHRSPAKRKNAPFPGEPKRDVAIGRSPGRRPEPSPNRDRPGSGNVRRRDGGEISGRRSRSPATRADSGNPKTGSGRSTSARRAGRSPVRVGSGLGERTRKVDGDRKEADDNQWPPASDESLENPLVSLECFIFL